MCQKDVLRDSDSFVAHCYRPALAAIGGTNPATMTVEVAA
jgi:hypothetical protein